MRSRLELSIATLALVAVLTPAPGQAQDLSSCAQVNSLAEAGNIGDALWELDICRNVLETAWYDGLVHVLNVEIAGLHPSGGEVEGVMGINSVRIRHGEVETTFTSGTGTSESPMAGLSSLAGLSSALGMRQPGVEEVRLGRRTTGRLEEKSDGSFSLMVTLDEGVLMQEGPDRDQLQAVATETIRIVEAYFAN